MDMTKSLREGRTCMSIENFDLSIGSINQEMVNGDWQYRAKVVWSFIELSES